MILMIILGVVVLIVGKIKITRRISLTGKPARTYGISLIVLAIPVTLVSRQLAGPLLSGLGMATPVSYGVLNILVLAIAIIGPAVIISATAIEPKDEPESVD